VRGCGGVLAAMLLVMLLPACSPSCGGDRAGIVNSLATAERWVRVVDIGEPPGGAGTNVIDLEVLRDQLGARFEATMDALIGVSDVPRIQALLEDAGLTVDR
jgi:hypothetical protein